MHHYDSLDLTVCIIIAIVLVVIWLNTRQPRRQDSQGNSTNDIQSEQEAIFVIRAAQHGEVELVQEPRGNAGSENRSRSVDSNAELVAHTKTLAVWTGWLSVAGIFAAYFAWRTLSAISGQLEQMKVDQRPWIPPNLAIAGPLVFNDAGASLPIYGDFENTGKSPAVSVRVAIFLFFGIGHTDNRESQRTRCDAQRYVERPSSGPVVFPGDTHFWLSSPGAPRRGMIISNDGAAFPSVLGCIIYYSTFDETQHQTRFIYRLRETGAANYLFTNHGNIPADRLSWYPEQLGGFDAD
jgi:hypothetical protein